MSLPDAQKEWRGTRMRACLERLVGHAYVRFVLSGLSFAAVQSCANDCKHICISSVALTAHLSTSIGMLSGTTVKLCLNGACTTGTFSPTAPTDILTEGAFEAEAVAASEASGASVEMKILGGGGYTNGDVYALSIVDGSGTVLFSKSAIASYVDVDGPCGMRCEEFFVDLYP